MKAHKIRSVLLSMVPVVLLTPMVSPVSGQQPGTPVTVTVKGRVLDSDSKPIPGDPVTVVVIVSGNKQHSTSSRRDGSYEIANINIDPGERIESIEFDHKTMHPAFVKQLSGVDSTEVINKLMNGPLFGDPCPNEYDGLIDQLLTLEGIYYTRVAVQRASGADQNYYRTSLRQIVGPGSEIFARMEPAKADLLTRKRAELFKLYGLETKGEEPIAALGLCAKCTLGLKDSCQSSFVTFMRDQPSLYYLTGGGGGSSSHELVCHTSVPVLVKGKVVRASVNSAGKVVAGEFQATTFIADGRVQAGQNDDALIAGVGKCGRCDLNSGTECQNVIVAKIDSKPTYYWLQSVEASQGNHMSGQTYLARGRFITPIAPAPDKPNAKVGLFRASQLTALVGEPGTR